VGTTVPTRFPAWFNRPGVGPTPPVTRAWSPRICLRQTAGERRKSSGPSFRSAKQEARAIGEYFRHPDQGVPEWRAKLGRKHGVSPADFLVGRRNTVVWKSDPLMLLNQSPARVL
jgi:hypothetical protein